MGSKIGLALGSGGTRGFAHLGVLEVLEELGVEVHAVAGTSIGALIGGLYLTVGLPPLLRELPHVAELSILSFVEPGFPAKGLIQGNKIVKHVKEFVGKEVRVEDLPKEFCAVATDLERGEPYFWWSGDLITAVRSSIAVPGLFSPVLHEDRVLVDGGLVEPLPITPLREAGCDVVIAVSLYGKGGVSEEPVDHPKSPMGEFLKKLYSLFPPLETGEVERLNVIRVLSQSFKILEISLTRRAVESEKPDVLIEVPLADEFAFNFKRIPVYRKVGLEVARKVLPSALSRTGLL